MELDWNDSSCYRLGYKREKARADAAEAQVEDLKYEIREAEQLAKGVE